MTNSLNVAIGRPMSSYFGPVIQRMKSIYRQHAMVIRRSHAEKKPAKIFL